MGEPGPIVDANSSDPQHRSAKSDSLVRRQAVLRPLVACCLVEMLLGILVLLAIPIIQPDDWISERLATSAAALFVHPLIALWIARMIRFRWPHWYTLLGLVGIAASLAAIIFAAWKPPYIRTAGPELIARTWLTFAVAFAHFVVLLAVAAGARLGRWLALRILCSCLLAASFSVFVILLWQAHVEDRLWFLPWCLFIAAIAPAYTIGLSLVGAGTTTRWPKITRRTAVFTAWMTAALLIAYLATRPDVNDDSILRAIFLAPLVVGVASLAHAAAVTAVRRRARSGEGALVWPYAFDFRCPACQSVYSLSIAGGQCPVCALRVHARLYPEACLHCGYPMKGLTKPECPECGAAYEVR